MSSEIFETMLAARDIGLFRVLSETSGCDRQSLLAILDLVRDERDGYRYMEVGSHLGGTLGPFLLDPRCSLIYSIDPRPAFQPDERSVHFVYDGNSTARMLAGLKTNYPAETLEKLITIDLDAANLTRKLVTEDPDLIFIDAEHTNVAVFRDFLNTYRFARKSAAVAFHDSNLLIEGILNIEEFLRWSEVSFRSYFLPDNVYAIIIGEMVRKSDEKLAPIAQPRDAYIKGSRKALWDMICDLREMREGQQSAY